MVLNLHEASYRGFALDGGHELEPLVAKGLVVGLVEARLVFVALEAVVGGTQAARSASHRAFLRIAQKVLVRSCWVEVC